MNPAHLMVLHLLIIWELLIFTVLLSSKFARVLKLISGVIKMSDRSDKINSALCLIL